MVVEAAIRSAALPDRRAGWPVLAPVTIDGFGTAVPAHRIDGDEVLRLIAQVWPRLARRVSLFTEELSGTHRFLVRPIDQALLPLTPGDQAVRYAAEAPPPASTPAERAIVNAGTAIADIGLIVVSSCTGFVLPGVDVQLINHLGLRRDIRRMPFMNFGCAGGAAALTWASDWVRSHPDESALVVGGEVPSLPFRPADTSADNLLSVLVFGNGAGASVLRCGAAPGHIGIGRTGHQLVASSTDALGFERADDGFRVVGSRQLPRLLEAHLPALVADFIGDEADLDVIALHPGGQAIVDAVIRCLGLREGKLEATQRVMRNVGNTSSAAILFVLEELAANLPVAEGRGLATAFGPGLTVEFIELLWAS